MKKYELGRVLKFNKSEWGFISYSKGVLEAFSLNDKEVSAFKIDSVTFNRIYNASTDGVISKETINYIKTKEKEEKDLIKSLKKGIVFIGTNNLKYTFMGFKGKEISFFNDDNAYTGNLEFISSVTNEFNPEYINRLEPVKTKKEYNSLSLEEKLAIAVNYLKGCYDEEGTECKILEFGNIIEGEAYYHEVDKYYTLIGVQIKFKYKFDFMDDFKSDIGFFPIYIGKLPNYYPISFEESFGELDFNENSYTNGCGDNIEYFVKLVDKNEVEKVAKNVFI